MLPQYRKQGTDRWLRNAALCYPCWKFEHAEFVYRDDECPKGDLHYENIDYISVTLSTRKSNNPLIRLADEKAVLFIVHCFAGRMRLF